MSRDGEGVNCKIVTVFSTRGGVMMLKEANNEASERNELPALRNSSMVSNPYAPEKADEVPHRISTDHVQGSRQG